MPGVPESETNEISLFCFRSAMIDGVLFSLLMSLKDISFLPLML